jgi:hypothetical protein
LTGGSADQSWQSEASRYRIEFTGNILEELRFEASRAMNGVACIGIGGVLLGRRVADGALVESWKPIACDHSRGPGFLLSARDEAELGVLLTGCSGEAQAEVLGWFVSHPKGKLEATVQELALHSRHLPAASFLMVARPDRLGDVEVQIHLPSSEGPSPLKAAEPLLIIEPVPVARREPGPRRPRKVVEAPEVLAALSGQQVQEPVVPVAPKRAANPKAIWSILAFSLILLSVGGAGIVQLLRPRMPVMKAVQVKADPPMEMLSLHAAHQGRDFVITWNGTSAAVRYASKATLELHSAGKVAVIPLSQQEMVTGEFRFKQRRGTETVRAKLVLQGEGGGSFDETTEIVDAQTTAAAVSGVTPDMVPPASTQKN